VKLLAVVPLLLACSGPSPAQSPTLDFSGSGVGPLRFCDPLTRVDSLWPTAIDTTLESEGVTWPGKVIRVAGGGNLLLEASWFDSAHVWRASTDAAGARGPAGLRVGMNGREMLNLDLELTVTYAEGHPYLEVGDHGIAVELDSASAEALAQAATAHDSIVGTAVVVRLLAHGPRCR
jgi:hypothetical protein